MRKKNPPSGIILLRSTLPVLALLVFLGLSLCSIVYGAQNDFLTHEERQWLTRHDGEIVLGYDPSARPIEFYDKDGKFSGLAADYVNLLQKKLDFTFKLSHSNTWEEVVDKARDRKIDVLCAFSATPERSKWMLFTPPYLEIPAVILTRTEIKGPLTLDQMKGMKITYTKGWVMEDFLRDNFGYLDLVPAIDEQTAIKNVSLGQADAAVTAMTTAVLTIAEYKISNLHVVGNSGFFFKLSMASRSDWPILHRILSKGLARITPREREAIYQKWISLERPSLLKSKKFWYVVLAVIGMLFLVVAVTVFWNLTLKAQVNQKTAALQREIAERRLVEEELRQSEIKFKTLFEQAGDYILVLAPQPGGPPVIVDANQAAIEKHGYSREEFIGKPISDLDDSRSREHVIERDRRLMAGEHLIFETNHIKKDGSTFPVEASVKLFKTGENSFLFLSIERDITERKMAEETLKLSNERYQQITTNLPGLVYQFVLHPDGTYSMPYVSEDVQSMFGVSSAEAINDVHSLLQFIHPGDIAAFDRSIKDSAASLQPYDHEFRSVIDGNIVWLQARSSPKRLAGGDILWDGILLDITDRKKAEEEKALLEQRLNQAQKMEAIGTLAGGIAHDFNNILGTILGFAELAQEDALPGSRYKNDLEKILVAATRAKELVKQILAFSRQADVERIPIKIQPLIKEGLKMLRSSIPSTISITEFIEPKCGSILADPTQIHQILMNLCTNAFHAMESTGGELSVSLRPALIEPGDQEDPLGLAPGEYVKLSVSDTGYGIKPDIIDKIYDPFFTTKEAGKGTGMGLAITHGIVLKYGGTIKVSSQLGKGSTFQVYLPAIKQEALPEIIESEDIPRGNERVLFIDDEELLAEMGKDMLERLGYRVTSRQSSMEALQTFQKSPKEFDLVISDQTMPVLTGSELAGRILQIRPDIPIILCTGYSNQIDQLSAKAIGIKEFALKPLTRKTIALLIRKVLDV